MLLDVDFAGLLKAERKKKTDFNWPKEKQKKTKKNT